METITPLIQDYIVDFASNNNFFFIKGIQGDGYGTRYARISLSNNGQPYIINQDAIRAIIRGTKPDTKQIFNTCEIIDESTIQFELTNQMLAVAGKGEYEISIMSTTENRTLTSFPFFVMTSKTSFDASYVTSSDEFTLLVSKINQVDVLIDETEKTIEEAESAINNCESATEKAVDATNNATKATEDIRSLESDITEAEESRVQAEKLRQENTSKAIEDTEKATSDANKATDDLRQLESVLNTNEEERQSNETKRQTDTATAINNAEKATQDAIDATTVTNTATIEAKNATTAMYERINQYDSLNLITVTQNAIDATNDTIKATNNTNVAIEAAEKATSDANYATEQALKAVDSIQEAIGIDDSKESLTTAWSSTHTHEVILEEFSNNMIPVTNETIDSLFIE